MNKGAITFADTAGKVADGVSKMADALAKIRDWSGIGRESMTGFSFNVRDIVADFAGRGAEFETVMLTNAEALAQTSGKVADAISKMADALGKVRDWSGIGRQSMTGFSFNVRDIIADFAARGSEFTTEMYVKAEALAKTAGLVADAVGKMATSLAQVKDYAGISRTNVAQFVADIGWVVGQMRDQAASFTKEMTDSTNAFSDTSSKVSSAMSSAFTTFSGIKKYSRLPVETVNSLVDDMVEVVKQVENMVTDAIEKLLPKATAFGTTIGTLTTGLKTAMELFIGLKGYAGTAPGVMQLFIDDVKLTITKVTEMTILTNDTLVKQVGAFGVAIGQLFDGLKKAMELFATLKDYKSTPSEVIQAFIEEIRLTIQKASEMNTETLQSLLPKAVEFATNTGDIFTKLKTALELFKSLATYKDDPTKAITDILNGMVNTIGVAASLDTKAVDLESKAQTYADTMQHALELFLQGQTAANQIGNMPTGGGGNGSGGTPLPNGPFLPWVPDARTDSTTTSQVAPPPSASSIVQNNSNSHTSTYAPQYNLTTTSLRSSEAVAGDFSLMQGWAGAGA
jgi:hypothetical protein